MNDLFAALESEQSERDRVPEKGLSDKSADKEAALSQSTTVDAADPSPPGEQAKQDTKKGWFQGPQSTTVDAAVSTPPGKQAKQGTKDGWFQGPVNVHPASPQNDPAAVVASDTRSPLPAPRSAHPQLASTAAVPFSSPCFEVPVLSPGWMVDVPTDEPYVSEYNSETVAVGSQIQVLNGDYSGVTGAVLEIVSDPHDPAQDNIIIEHQNSQVGIDRCDVQLAQGAARHTNCL